MKNVTSNRVLPHWAIEELCGIAKATGLKFTVHQVEGDWPHLEIRVVADIHDHKGVGVDAFLVTMRDDWEDLRILGEGDLEDIISERCGKYYDK